MHHIVLAIALIALPQDDVQKKIADLCGRLGSEEIAVRDLAVRELVTSGRQAIPAVEALLSADDAEVRQRAGEVLEKIRAALRNGALRLHVKGAEAELRPGDEIRIEVEVENVEDFPVGVWKGADFFGSTVRIQVLAGTELLTPVTGMPFQSCMPREAEVAEDSFATIAPRGRMLLASMNFFQRWVKLPGLKGEGLKVGPLPAGRFDVKVSCSHRRSDFAVKETRLLQSWHPIRVVFEGKSKALLDQAWEGSLDAETTFEVK